MALGLERPRGAWIGPVHEASPASRAGLRDGDVILRFDGIEIVDFNHLINVVSMAPVGKPAEVVVWRDRRELKFYVTVGERDQTLAQAPGTTPAPPPDPSGLVRRPNRPGAISSFVMGMELATLTPQLAQRVELPESWRGAVILSIDPESPFQHVVQRHDIISAINNQAIQSAEQVVTILNQRADHTSAIISLDRIAKGLIEHHTIRVP
jgi:serine protease Do